GAHRSRRSAPPPPSLRRVSGCRPARRPRSGAPQMSDCISIRRDGRCATIELNRPPLHILDLDLLAALDAGLAELAADRELQLVLLRGGGERAFSAGVSVQDH